MMGRGPMRGPMPPMNRPGMFNGMRGPVGMPGKMMGDNMMSAMVSILLIHCLISIFQSARTILTIHSSKFFFSFLSDYHFTTANKTISTQRPSNGFLGMNPNFNQPSSNINNTNNNNNSNNNTNIDLNQELWVETKTAEGKVA